MKTYECSSKGDKRFSAFYARIKKFDNRSIEDLYQVELKGYPSIKEGKGKKGLKFNFEQQKYGYMRLWFNYLQENPHLVDELLEITKTHVLTDMFAKPDSINQVDALTFILNKIKKGDWFIMARKSMNEVADISGGKRITEAGEYQVEIIKVEIKNSSEGTPIANLTLETTYEDGSTAVCWDRLAQTESALGFTKRYLSACGYDMDDLDYEVETKGNKKGQITKYYLTDENGNEEEYTIEELLQEEEVIITVKAQSKTYKDAADGKEKTRTNPGVDVVSVESVEEDEE